MYDNGVGSRGAAPRSGEHTATNSNAADRSKVTVPALRGCKGVRKISMVTAYDVTMARLLDEAGIDMLLVGDSLGMVVQGCENTLPVTVDEICYHGRAVARGARRAHIVGDMPFMSSQLSPKRALKNAGKMMKSGAFESVKLEGGREAAEAVHRIVQAGIPVVGHIGLTPQSVHAMGGFKVQGKGEAAAERLIADAAAIEQAGAFALVLEAVPPDVAEAVTRAIAIPTIGIGAGPHCDGQVLVSYDMFGMIRGFSPKFAKRYAELGDAIVDAARAFRTEVQQGAFPAREHCFKPNAPPPEESSPGEVRANSEPSRAVA